MPYRVELAPAAARELRRLDRSIQQRIGDALDALQQNPRPAGCKKLSGPAGWWRVRVGDYRIVYSIHDDRLLVLVVRVAHRKDVYR
jgi:mRNA interferase RelE/StbE